MRAARRKCKLNSTCNSFRGHHPPSTRPQYPRTVAHTHTRPRLLRALRDERKALPKKVGSPLPNSKLRIRHLTELRAAECDFPKIELACSQLNQSAVIIERQMENDSPARQLH